MSPTPEQKATANVLLTQAHIVRLAATAAERLIQDFIDGKIAPGEGQNDADVFKALVAGVQATMDIGMSFAGIHASDVVARALELARGSVGPGPIR